MTQQNAMARTVDGLHGSGEMSENEAQRAQDAIYHLAAKLQAEIGDHNSAAAEFRAIQSVIAESYTAGAAAENEACAKVANKFLGELSAEEWPPHGLYPAQQRFDNGVSALTAERIAEAIRQRGSK